MRLEEVVTGTARLSGIASAALTRISHRPPAPSLASTNTLRRSSVTELMEGRAEVPTNWKSQATASGSESRRSCCANTTIVPAVIELEPQWFSLRVPGTSSDCTTLARRPWLSSLSLRLRCEQPQRYHAESKLVLPVY